MHEAQNKFLAVSWIESHIKDLFSVLQVLPLTDICDFNHIWTCFNDVISSKRLLNTVHAVSCLQGSTLSLLLNKIVWFAYSYYRTAGKR